jgi:TetR/AcrR family tetracycline transcriptional repressor
VFKIGYAEPVKLTLDRIVGAGMDTFAELGYDGLSMRQVADRLDVHAGSLYYHVQNKDALLTLMADRVAQEAYDAGTTALAALPATAGWRERIEAQALTLRASIQQHRGGAVLLAGSPNLLSPGALALMERLLITLRQAGVPAGDAAVAAGTLLSHVTGFVLQEQGDSTGPALSAEQIAQLGRRFPLTMAGAAGGALDQDELFARSVRLLCAAVATLIEGGETA